MTRGKGGFTLIELLLVMVILGIVLALNFPDLKRAYSGLELRQTADTMVYFMRYARSRAVLEGVDLKMVVTPDAFQLRKGTDLLPGRMGRRMGLPAGVLLQEAPFQVVFGSDGKMDPVAFSIIRDRRKFVISTKEMPGHVVLFEQAKE